MTAGPEKHFGATSAGSAVPCWADRWVRSKAPTSACSANRPAWDGEGLLDCLSSDYAPSSQPLAVLNLHRKPGGPLPRAAAMVGANPTEATGLSDRGRIEPNLRADLTRISLHDDTPVVRTVWRQGRRIS